MIAKKVARKSQTKKSFSGLAGYILDSKRQGHKLADSWLVNCLAPTHSLALKEIEATQSLNSRTKKDKTYHLVISFRPGEQVEVEVMKKVEALICERLGYGEHQRVVAVHNDTKSLHLHLAISKIHPQKLTIHDPQFDYKKISDACLECELKYGLERDNRIPPNRSGASLSSKARDKEAHSGEESFQRWLRNNLKSDLDKALSRTDCSWEMLHLVVANYDVGIRPRANGLIFCHRNRQLFVKASSVSRDFGMGRLEQKLGKYSSITNQLNIKPNLSYSPMAKKLNSPLYEKYLFEKERVKTQRKSAFDEIRAEYKARYDGILHEYKKRKSETKFNKLIRRKKHIYSVLTETKNRDLKALKVEFAEKRAEVASKYKFLNWKEFQVSESKLEKSQLDQARQKPARKISRNSKGLDR